MSEDTGQTLYQGMGMRPPDNARILAHFRIPALT